MNDFLLPIIAAFACALANGLASILQKVSADKEKTVTWLDAGFLIRLVKNKPYSIGISLNILGWLLTVYSVHYLALFLVQSIIACNIIVTALIERFYFHKNSKNVSLTAIFIILSGLVLLILSSSSQEARVVSNLTRLIIVLTPVLIFIIGYFLAKIKTQISTIALSFLGGIAFGVTSIDARIFRFSQPAWHTIYSPVVFSIIFSAIIGLLLFSIALQRARVTVVNAVTNTTQTLFPSIIGIAILGDVAKDGRWYLVIIGGLLALFGIILLTLKAKQNEPLTKKFS